MIDFNYTEKQNGIITFVNEKGEAVKRYALSELEQYVKDKLLNLDYKWIQNEKGEPEEIEVCQDITEYIDENFEKLTEDFYNFKNK